MAKYTIREKSDGTNLINIYDKTLNKFIFIELITNYSMEKMLTDTVNNTLIHISVIPLNKLLETLFLSTTTIEYTEQDLPILNSIIQYCNNESTVVLGANMLSKLLLDKRVESPGAWYDVYLWDIIKSINTYIKYALSEDMTELKIYYHQIN